MRKHPESLPMSSSSSAISPKESVMAEDAKPVRTNPGTRVTLACEELVAAIAMALLGLITFANVVVRYLTNYSLAFTEEYSIVLMVAVALLGTAIAAARDSHIRVTWFIAQLPRRSGKVDRKSTRLNSSH